MDEQLTLAQYLAQRMTDGDYLSVRYRGGTWPDPDELRTLEQWRSWEETMQ